MISKMGAGIAAAVLSTSALGQEAESGNAAASDLKWIVSEQLEWHDIEGGDLYVFNTEFALKFGEGTDITIDVPVYNQGGSTSVGSVRLGAEVDAFSGENDVTGKWDLALGGGVYVPVGSETFDAQNLDPFLTGRFGCKVWILDFMQTAEYRWVGGEAYIPWLGAKTDSDVLVLGSLLSYGWGDLHVGADFTQVYYVGSEENQLFVGPAARWDVTSNISLDAVVEFPLTQDIAAPETDMIVSVGLGIKF